MITIKFMLNQKNIDIQTNQTDKFRDIVNKYCQKAGLKLESCLFLFNGDKLNLETTPENLDINLNLSSIIILVQLIDENPPNENFLKSKEIICPKCKESCRIKITNGKFILYGCMNNHISKNIKIKDFSNTQKLNMNNIICINDKDNNMGNSYEYKFYRCLTCKDNICLLCQQKHDINHTVVEYENRNYECIKHNNSFIKYCETCKLNLCLNCISKHEGHEKIFSFERISPEKEISKFNNTKNLIFLIIKKKILLFS